MKIELDIEYNGRYDAYYDALKDLWLESECGDPDCQFCAGRPEKPSMVDSTDQTVPEG